jgi:outer membrane protein OmpA-like peptidoglycan-associated protein
VVPVGIAEPEGPSARQQVRAAVGLADGNQVLVRADLSDELVYQLTQLIFEHADLMRSAYAEVGDLEPGASLERITGAVHPGALRYYDEHAERQATVLPASDAPASDDAAAAPPKAKSFIVYFGFDDAEFDLAQIGVVQEACGYAGTLPTAEFILSGHADTVGPEPYNDQLSLARARSVASMIRNDERFRDALNVIKFGEKGLAVPTPDGVAEPKNRRVVITVVPGEVDQATLDQVKASAASTEPRPQE